MNKSFILLDRNSNLKKNAHAIVKFNFEERDYLIYSIEENEQNSQIFVSRIILNSEGKYFIENVLPEEKSKLNNIVYNIVILIPAEEKKGSSFEVLSKNLFDKFAVKLSHCVPINEIQEYYNSCSVAITNKLLVETAANFYDKNLTSDEEKNISEIPVWTAPIEVTAPTPIDNNNVSIVENLISDSNINKVEAIVPITPNLLSESNIEQKKDENNLPNQQAQKLAIMSDPSLGFGIIQPEITQNKKAGFASSKYVIIGTVCIVLAIVVIIIAYLLISNMK